MVFLEPPHRRRIGDSPALRRYNLTCAGYVQHMRAVFSSWLIAIAVGLAYMITIPLLGR
jgi:hypothetical protein